MRSFLSLIGVFPLVAIFGLQSCSERVSEADLEGHCWKIVDPITKRENKYYEGMCFSFENTVFAYRTIDGKTEAFDPMLYDIPGSKRISDNLKSWRMKDDSLTIATISMKIQKVSKDTFFLIFISKEKLDSAYLIKVGPTADF